MLEREVLEAAKAEEVTPLQLSQLAEDLLSQENPHLYEQNLERLVEELIALPEVHQRVSMFQFPAKQQASLQQKREAKEYLEQERITHLVKKYSDHIDFPIFHPLHDETHILQCRG